MKDELEGVELDNAVALALGHKLVGAEIHDSQTGYIVDRTDYSTDWAVGGPIIESARMMLDWEMATGQWVAVCGRETGFESTGPTPLIAAMRVFVAWRNGTTCCEWDARP